MLYASYKLVNDFFCVYVCIASLYSIFNLLFEVCFFFSCVCALSFIIDTDQTTLQRNDYFFYSYILDIHGAQFRCWKWTAASNITDAWTGSGCCCCYYSVQKRYTNGSNFTIVARFKSFFFLFLSPSSSFFQLQRFKLSFVFINAIFPFAIAHHTVSSVICVWVFFSSFLSTISLYRSWYCLQYFCFVCLVLFFLFTEKKKKFHFWANKMYALKTQ